jgi:hypothetical protein
VANEADLGRVLRAIQNGDDANELADNAQLASRLDLTLVMVASILEDAKERSLIWGQRSGDKPGPWFKELELTVQGRRFLVGHDTD